MTSHRRTWQVILGGSGGQGMILAGLMLGEAAAYQLDMEVAQTQSYGAASRGGYSESRVVISHDEIAYPDVTCPDVLVALTPDAYLKHKDEVDPEGIILLDAEAATEAQGVSPPKAAVVECPIAATARAMGAAVNMVSLGVLIGSSGLMPPEAMKAAIKERFSKPGVAERNLEAFEAGLSVSEEMAPLWRNAGA